MSPVPTVLVCSRCSNEYYSPGGLNDRHSLIAVWSLEGQVKALADLMSGEHLT